MTLARHGWEQRHRILCRPNSLPTSSKGALEVCNTIAIQEVEAAILFSIEASTE